MAEKGFGVKEINLIGASGTPTIESPNNLNLNAVNVAISTNVSIGGTLTVSGNISVGGTLTYEDVTNIDSVGIITARNGISVTSGGITVLGGTITGTATTATSVRTTDESSDTTCFPVFTTAASGDQFLKTGTNLTFNSSNGTLTATTFSGSGASLTSLPAANLTGTLPAISGANLTGIAVTEAPVVDYTVTANGSSAYRFHGGGVDETANNPDLYLIRGQKYRFNNTTGSGHPFAIREANGGSAYTNGVTGNNQGVQFFTVPYDAPAKIFYQCTIHSGMVGNIYIRGANGQNDNVGITTFSGSAAFLHVSKSYTAPTGGIDGNTCLLLSNSGGSAYAGLAIQGTTSGGSYIHLGDTDDINVGNILYDHPTNSMQLITNASEKVRIGSSGQIGLSGANYGSSGQVLTSQGSGSAVVWANAGITMADQWRVTSSSTLPGSVSILNSNWARVASPSGYGNLGSAMSESSGAFTFPATGIYYVEFTILISMTQSARYLGNRIQTSTDNFSSANTVAETLGHMALTNSFGAYHTSTSSFIFDVTNTSTHKVRFCGVSINPSASSVIGNTNQNSTFATFIRLGDT